MCIRDRAKAVGMDQKGKTMLDKVEPIRGNWSKSKRGTFVLCSGELRVQTMHEHCCSVAGCYLRSVQWLFSQKDKMITDSIVCCQTQKSHTVLLLSLINDRTHKSISRKTQSKTTLRWCRRINTNDSKTHTAAVDNQGTRCKTKQVLYQNRRRAGDWAECEE